MRPLLALAAACALLPAADPATDLAGWIQAVREHRIADQVARLPEARRTTLALAWSDEAVQDRGPRRGGWDMPLRGIAQIPGDGAGQLLLSMLAEAGAALDPVPATAAPAADGGDQRIAWMGRFMGRSLPGGVVRSVLAAGIESRQIEALDRLAADYRAWAATQPPRDPARVAAAAAGMGAAIKGLALDDQGLSGLPMTAALARIDAALPGLVQALAGAGLDADAMLASARVETESRTATRAVAVVSFTAFGRPHAVPIALVEQGGAWAPVADSPALRWLSPMQGMGMGMGRGRGQGGPRGPRGGDQPADAPAPAGTPAPAGAPF
ncbi:MAG: hypothetical protein RLZZ127_914 [Planctomycetota bacterium]|jgi:hypothetical protein